MKETTKILWSGITGRTGSHALLHQEEVEGVKIVAGICRNNKEYYNYEQLDNIKEDFDVIVDFSHTDSFDKVLEFSIKSNKPFIIGTAKLTEEQSNNIEEAAKIIPIFRGGNFQFKVKKFIDDIVEYSKTNDNLKLIETHYKTKKIPSETSKVIVRRVKEETGKDVEVESRLEYEELINDYVFGPLHCQVCGFEQLSKDVLKISKMMHHKKASGVYDLDRLLREENYNENNN